MSVYNRQYTDRVNWQNAPSVSTPLDEEKLNIMDAGLEAIDAEAKRAVDALVEMIEGGGGGADLGEKTITRNGIYLAEDDDLDGYSKVTVDVEAGVGIYLMHNGQTDATFVLTNEAGGAYADPVENGIDLYPHLGGWGTYIDLTDVNEILIIFSSVTVAQYSFVGVGSSMGYNTSASYMIEKQQMVTNATTHSCYFLNVSQLSGYYYLQHQGGFNARAVVKDIILI